MTELDLFVACLPGLEPMLAAEIDALGLGATTVEPGGVALRTDRRGMMRANRELGLASHVLLRVSSFQARSLGELLRKTTSLDWQALLAGGAPGVRAVCRKSRLYHSGAVEQRVREGIAARLRGSDGGEAVVVQARLLHDTCTLSIDTSGAPLHRRGWRVDGGKAPLREDLARALVLASGWDGTTPLVDPLMGSGTIVLEAAALALRMPPGAGRTFAFEATPLFDAATWREVVAAGDARVLTTLPAKVAGSDRDAGAVQRARDNAQRLGVEAHVELRQAALRDATFLGDAAPPAAGAVVTNPPFGHRIGDHRLPELYQSLGALLRRLPGGWRVAILAADRRLALRTGLPLRTAFLTGHGGLKVRALVAAAVR